MDEARGPREGVAPCWAGECAHRRRWVAALAAAHHRMHVVHTCTSPPCSCRLLRLGLPARTFWCLKTGMAELHPPLLAALCNTHLPELLWGSAVQPQQHACKPSSHVHITSLQEPAIWRAQAAWAPPMGTLLSAQHLSCRSACCWLAQGSSEQPAPWHCESSCMLKQRQRLRPPWQESSSNSSRCKVWLPVDGLLPNQGGRQQV